MTAPKLNANPLVPGSGIQAAPVVSKRGAAHVDEPAADNAEGPDGVPYVLPSELHPWPLRFREAAYSGTLFLDMPTEQEARIMLPGKSADMADRARFTISKFISDSIGTAAQLRGRQSDGFDSWASQADTQYRQVSPDPWQQYQFNLELRREVLRFREGVANQGVKGIQRMVEDVKQGIAKIAPLVNLMPTYELKTAWYSLMVQLKDGAGLYQKQVSSADTQLLLRIDNFLKLHPAIARPAGAPPEKPSLRKVAAPESFDVTEPPVVKPTPVPKEPAKAVEPEAKATSTANGMLIAGGVMALLAGVVVRLRQRKKGAPSIKQEPA